MTLPKEVSEAIVAYALAVGETSGRPFNAQAWIYRVEKGAALESAILSALDAAREQGIRECKCSDCDALASRPEPARPDPTHRCKVCGALWLRQPLGWTLWSKTCGACCDNQPMGEQIEPITEFHRLCDPGPMGEPAAPEPVEHLKAVLAAAEKRVDAKPEHKKSYQYRKATEPAPESEEDR